MKSILYTITTFTAFLLFAGFANANVGTPNTEVTQSYIVIEQNSGRILDSYNANLPQYPASLTKVMTLYILFDEIKAKRISMNDKFTASKLASRQVPSKIGIREGEQIKVSEAIDAMIVKSANDVAVVIAENIAGSVEEFSNLMNKKAKELKLRNTNFRNPSGLPDRKQVTTARDMVLLSRSMINDHPEYYYLFNRKKATVKGKTYNSHNALLGSEGIDGLKTGYTSASGFHIAISSENSGLRLTAVYMGYKSTLERNQTAYDIIKTNIEETIRARLESDVNKNSFYTPEFLVSKNKDAEQIRVASIEKDQRNIQMDTSFRPTEDKVLGIKQKEVKKEEINPQQEQIQVAIKQDSKKEIPQQHRVSSEEVIKDMTQVAGNSATETKKIAENINDSAKKVAVVTVAPPTPKIENNKSAATNNTTPKKQENNSLENNNQPYANIGGNYYIQLGAFSSQGTANTIITQAKKLVGIVRQNTHIIEKIELKDGRSLYRAIINASSETQAKQACGVIRNSGNECLVMSRKVSVEI